jgi:hypothetical protein
VQGCGAEKQNDGGNSNYLGHEGYLHLPWIVPDDMLPPCHRTGKILRAV